MPATHAPPSRQPLRRRLRHAGLLSILCSLCSLPAATAQFVESPTGDVYKLTRQAIAGGGSTGARSACFDLDSTVGQADAGTAQGGGYTLISGFFADLAHGESLFRSGFEGCQP